MFRWAPHVDHDHIARVRAAFDALPAQVPQVRQYVHGTDVGVAEGNFDYVVVADFDQVEDWRAYRDHPAHVLLVEELITPHVADRAAVQYQTGAERAAPTMPDPLAGPGFDEYDDDELLARARRAAMADMEALLAEPDD